MNTAALFTSTRVGPLALAGRIVRSATYEGLAAADGTPLEELGDLYRRLAAGGCALVTTGFAYVDEAGRAMHPAQAGIHQDRLVGPWQQVLMRARKEPTACRFVMQLAHAGRQTRRLLTHRPVLGAGSRRCTYFRQAVRAMSGKEIRAAAAAFGEAARRAQEAGFDGVQVHAAHGYLLHQFRSPWTNQRRDEWRDGDRLLQLVVEHIRERVNGSFAVLMKLSWADDNAPGVRLEDTVRTIQQLRGVDACEISYGTMEYALNIIRGDCPVETALQVNPLFNRLPRLVLALWRRFRLPAMLAMLKPFTEDYNLEAAITIRQAVVTPIYPVGGIRSADSLVRCVTDHGFPVVALCRPLIHDPQWPQKLRENRQLTSGCTNCNLCTVHVDSRQPLRCYRSKGEHQ